VAEERGNLAKADQYYQEELKISERLEPDSLDMAGTYNNLGYVARDRNDWVKAMQYQQHALEIETRLAPKSLWVAETLHNLGVAAEAQGDLLAAEQHYREALAIRERLASGSKDHAETLVALASVLRRQGQTQLAEGVYEQALLALEQQADHLGGSYDVRSDFRARHATYYKDYAHLLMSENRPDAALEVLERSRARMLLEMMTAAHLDIRNGVDPKLLAQKQSLEEEISAKTASRIRLLNAEHTDEQVARVRSEIKDLLKQHEDVEDQIRLRSPNYASLVQPKPLSTKQIQSELIDADTLLVEYSLGEEHSHVLLASSDRVDSYDIPKRSEVEDAARSMYNHLTASNRTVKGETAVQRRSRLDREQAGYERAAFALSQMILKPIADHLGRKRLLIVSDGALLYIPFAALPVPDEKETGRAGVPLVVDHEIVNLPSASVLAVLRQEEMSRPKAPKAVAVLADPVFDRQDSRVRITREIEREPKLVATDPTRFRSASISRLQRSIADVRSAQAGSHGAARDLRLSRLWFTRLEADRILAVTPQGQGIKAVDFEASRTKATSQELATYRIVHFATHGLLDSQNPELSGLVFSMVDANGHVQDGFLDLQDIYNLNLPADMVVLSACETGLGKEIDGEGMIGLTRGFMYSGATRVVASLWRVSDVATAELMEHFYQAMEQDGMRPAAALRMAQIQMWKQHRWTLPYYWAAFQIHGEWR
jgi:CHAT domain-containing protein/Tfp pilus assembly protein PilF